MSSVVKQRSVTFINSGSLPKLTTKDLDLDSCYNENEIVIKVYSAALNPVDSIMHYSANKWITSSSLKTYGKDYAGVIVKRGDKVDPKFKVGDKVNGLIVSLFGTQGSFSDYLVLDPSKQASIGHMNNFDYLDNYINSKFNEFDINASYPLVFGTAYFVLFNKGQKWTSDSKILVNGASTAVSHCLIQIAKKYLNIGTVVGICNSKSFEYNKKAGFDHLIAYDELNILGKVQSLVNETFNGGKFDLIFDSVGTSQFFPIIETILKPKSENSYYLTIVGKEKLKYNSSLLDYMCKIPVFDYIKSFNPWRKFNYDVIMLEPKANYMELASKMISKKEFLPPLDSLYNFEDFQEALDKLNSNKARGKIILRINED
ncbi:Yim1p PWA37_005208 [Arxiozyma heterogenica]|uniref:Yim1p n=1 Tax=Arxiozyma heterogenica TaxID=278026 RepID=UPI002EE51583